MLRVYLYIVYLHFVVFQINIMGQSMYTTYTRLHCKNKNCDKSCSQFIHIKSQNQYNKAR